MSNGDEQAISTSTKGTSPTVVIIIALVCIFFGYLTTKIYSLDKQLNNHYKTITTKIETLERNGVGFSDELNKIQSQLSELCTNIQKNFEDVRKENKQLNQEILDEIRKQRGSENPSPPYK